MRAISRRVQRLETTALAQDQGIIVIVSHAGCEEEVAASDIQALQEGGYLRRGGINLIRLGGDGEIKNISDSARQYLAERKRRWRHTNEDNPQTS